MYVQELHGVMSGPDECQPWLVNCGVFRHSSNRMVKWYLPSHQQPFGFINVYYIIRG